MHICFKKAVRKLIFLSLLILLVSFYNNGYAQQFYIPQTFQYNTGEASEKVTGNDLFAHTFPDTIEVFCHDWDSLTSNPTWWDRNKLKSNNAFIKFYVDKAFLRTKYGVPVNYNYWLTYMVYGFNDPTDTVNGFVVSGDTLSIAYNSAADNTLYQNMSVKKFSNFYKMKVVLTGLYENVGSTFATASFADSTKRNFIIEGSILTQHYDKTLYGIGSAPPVISGCTGHPGASGPDYIKLRWDFPGGASITPVNYELEWTYTDDYKVNIGTGVVSSKSAGDLAYNFLHNSTRVWLNDNTYTIPKIQSRGYLVYRVRAIRPDSVLYKYPIYGPWSLSGPDSGSIASLTACNDYYAITTAYTGDSLNWQYSANFAESGKFKHVASFYDGLLKNRQSITRCTDTNKIIVTANVYDYEGRPSVTTLPAPTTSSAFSFKHNVIVSALSTIPYHAGDFDSGLTICPIVSPPPPVDMTSLAAHYYSADNHDTFDTYNKYIPNAEGYPFVQTKFLPGFNDRVAAQSQPGGQTQIGDILQNYVTNSYVSPSQKALNANFGTNVGFANYYNMTVNRDANQQLSMVVKDYEGKQMASAIIGLGPNPVNHAIEPLTVPGAVFYKENLLAPGAPNQVIDPITGARSTDVDFFNQVTATDSLQYSYTFLPFLACPGIYLSVKGHYQSVVTDDCGYKVAEHNAVLGPNGITSSAPFTLFIDTAFSALPGAYHLHKSLAFHSNDVNEALDSLFSHPLNCFRSENSFIKESIDSAVFPCSQATMDTTPCDKMKWEMMQQLFPGGAYGGYSSASGHIVGTENSVFSIDCPPDTTYKIVYDTSGAYCYNIYRFIPLRYGVQGYTANDSSYLQYSWYYNAYDVLVYGIQLSMPLAGANFSIPRDTCFFPLDTFIYPNFAMELGAPGKVDSIFAIYGYDFKGEDLGLGNNLTGQIKVIFSDTVGFENGALIIGGDSVGSIATHFNLGLGGGLLGSNYTWVIHLPAKFYDTTIEADLICTLPSGKAMNLHFDVSGIPIEYSPDHVYTYNVIDEIRTGYSSGVCSYFPGAHYRYQDTCTIPFLPDSITIAGNTYRHLRTMNTDSFVLVYNASIAEGNYAIAEALLPLHPQYCALQNCFNDTFKTQILDIPNWHVAQSLGLLLLDSIVAHDPLIPLMAASGHFPSPEDSLRHFEGGTYLLDTFLFMNAYCACTDQVMFAQCVSSMFPYEITHRKLVNDKVKAYYFDNLPNLYINNRQKYVDKLLMLGGNCANCATARMTLDPGAVIPPAPYPIGFADVRDADYPGSGSGWLGDVLLDSSVTSFDSALMARMKDSVYAVYRITDSTMTYATIDTIVARLSNCIAGNPLVEAGIRDSLAAYFHAGAVSLGEFTDVQIRAAITGNGLALNDLCNPYVVGSCELKPPATPVNDCLPNRFYTDESNFMNASAVLNALTVPGTNTYILDTVGNTFEQKVGRALGNHNSCSITGSYDVGKQLYEIDITAAGTVNVVKIYMHSPVCGDVYATPGVTSILTMVNCSNTDPSLSTTTGFIGEFSFVAKVQVTAGITTTNCALTGWVDSLHSMGSRSNAISGCVPCTQMRELYTRYNDSLIADSIYGVDHPYYDVMLVNFMNTAIGQQFTATDYKTFIQSCALADSMLMPLYTGYATYIFPGKTEMDSFTNMLNRIDPDYSFDDAYRDSAYAGGPVITMCVDLNKVPVSNLWKYRDSLNYYTGVYTTKLVNMPLSTLQPPGTIGFIYLPPGYPFNPSDSDIVDTASVKFYGTPKAVWIGGRFEMQMFYNVVANVGTPPYTISKDVFLLSAYMNKIPGAVFVPSYQSTVNGDYFKSHKQAYLTYNYHHQHLPAYAVLDSLQPQYLTSRIPAYSGYSASYLQPLMGGTPADLYLGSGAMSNRYFDTLQAIINNSGTSGHIFYSAKKVNRPLSGPRQLDAYRCSDGSYWYRYFTTGDTLFNVYVSFPGYIPKNLRQSYGVVGPVMPIAGDSLNRSFMLKLVRTGTTDTIRAYGRTSFVIGTSIELNNVLLGNPVTATSTAMPDTFDNCERHVLYASINEGMVKYHYYLDSAKQNIKAAFAEHLATAVQEELHLGYWNNEFNYTLYNYDRAGNLISTVPPVGTLTPIAYADLDNVDDDRRMLTTSSLTTPSYSMKNTYTYNTGNQVKEQTTIDGGLTRFFYDEAGRLVFSQNAKQALSGNYTYNTYDQQGRITETGEIYIGGPPAPFIVEHSNMLRYDSVLHFIQAKATRYDVVMTIYDTAASDLSAIGGLDAQQNLRKRVSCIKYFEILDTISQGRYTHATHYSYDIAGNVNTLVQDFPDMDDYIISSPVNSLRQRYKRIDYDYDLVSGKVNMLSYNRGRQDQFYQQYKYDILNRLEKVQTSNDGYLWQNDASYSYYQHGPLARQTVGDPDLQGTVQGMDYAYTIQGWLKALNNDSISSAVDMGGDGRNVASCKDAAGYALDYFNTDYTPITPHSIQNITTVSRSLYNGNISRQTTAINSFQRLTKQYVYDQLNRIHSANYATIDPVTSVLNGLTAYHNHYQYDANGNLEKLVRYGSETAGVAQLMDSFHYDYGTGTTNRLNQIYEHSADNYPSESDIKPSTIIIGSSRYKYDAIGNTIQDMVSAQDTIEWNLYNKVKRSVNNADTSQLLFGYDALGNRTVKRYIKYDNSNTFRYEKKDYYVRDAQGNILALYHNVDTFVSAHSFDSLQLIGRQFNLAEHNIYGTGRIGVKSYYPGQMGLKFYNRTFSLIPVEYHDSLLWAHKPWYSLEYQDVIKTDSLNQYSNSHTDSLYYANIAGQKKFEVADHLGNVMTTVLDKRAADSLTGPLVFGNNVTVASWKPIVTNAYDYYPFGQPMPGRSRGDSSAQCITLLKPTLTSAANHMVQSWAGGPAWGTVTTLAAGTVVPMTWNTELHTSNVGDGLSYTIAPVDPGVLNVIKVDFTYWAGTSYFINVVDGATNMSLGSASVVGGTSRSSWVYIPVTPSSSSIKLWVTASSAVVYHFDIGQIEFDTVTYTSGLVSTTICDDDGYRYGYNGQMKVNEIAGLGNHNTAKYWELDTRTARRWNLDPVDQISISNYAVNGNNPILLNDPDGDCPNCVTAAIGAGIGALVGGAIEIGSQLYQSGSVNNWSAVGGSALQGGITGGAAGFTGGASLLTTAVVSGGANALGGAANRAVQGQGTTVVNVVTDVTVGGILGAGGKFVGNVVEDVTNNLSRSAKGTLGEAITEIKYGAQGYKSAGKAEVLTGGRTATGKPAKAIYDHKMTNVFTGKKLTVESKFNGSKLTRNQAAAQSNVITPGGLIIDRTTSQGLGNSAKAATVGTGAGIDAQRNKKP